MEFTAQRRGNGGWPTSSRRESGNDWELNRTRALFLNCTANWKREKGRRDRERNFPTFAFLWRLLQRHRVRTRAKNEKLDSVRCDRDRLFPLVGDARWSRESAPPPSIFSFFFFPPPPLMSSALLRLSLSLWRKDETRRHIRPRSIRNSVKAIVRSDSRPIYRPWLSST